MAELTIRGIPDSIARDGWWLGSVPAKPDGFSGSGERERWPGREGLALAALIAIADVLFYRQTPGLSLAMFSAAVLAGVVLTGPAPRLRKGPVLLLGIAALPVVEHLQALSVGLLGLGLLASVAWAGLGDAAVGDVLRGVAGLARRLPFFGLRALIRLATAAGTLLRAGVQTRQVWRAWAFPAGGALVLASLLVEANPILADWLMRLGRIEADPLEWAQRGVFWLGVGLLVWPLLLVERQALGVYRPLPGGPRVLGLNAASVANALVTFNLLLGVQTLMDARYLWAGAALPAGLSHADYAHRGAYPLLATALLAGAFSLTARPFLDERRGLRALVLLWLGQNVLLVLSAVYRLDLYVVAYGLTYLRIHAAIWMVLVAAGLLLTGWQIRAGRSNLWLIGRCAGLGLGTLYLCAFVNFAGIIAAHNLARDPVADPAYLCTLGPTATPAILASGVLLPCATKAPVIRGWRDWGFRNWRVARYLDHATPEPLHEDPRGR